MGWSVNPSETPHLRVPSFRGPLGRPGRTRRFASGWVHYLETKNTLEIRHTKKNKCKKNTWNSGRKYSNIDITLIWCMKLHTGLSKIECTSRLAPKKVSVLLCLEPQGQPFRKLFLKNWMDIPSLHVSHETTLITFHYTCWFIGILIMVYYDPYRTG